MKGKRKPNEILGYMITLMGLMLTLFSVVVSLDVEWLEEIDRNLLLYALLVLMIGTLAFTFLVVLSRINPKQYIMISYAGADEPLADAIKACLEFQFRRLSKYRFEVLTHENIPFGSDFSEATQSHIEKANIILTLVTKNYVESERCGNEFVFLVNEGKKIVPIVMDSYLLLSRLPVDYSNVKALMLRTDDLDGLCDDEELIKLAKELIKNRRD